MRLRACAAALTFAAAAALTPGHVGPAHAEVAVVSEAPAALREAEALRLHSAILNRDLMVYVAPPSRALPPGTKAAAVYSLDGDSSFGMVRDIARRLQNAQEMAPAFVVSIGYPADAPGGNQRDHDYIHERLQDVPGSGGGGDFERFILEELRPFIERRYLADPGRAVLAGHSFGGLFVANVLVRHPDAFSAYLVSSGSLWVRDEAVVKAAAKLAKAGRGGGRKVFLSVGRREGDPMIEPILRFGDQLADKASGFSVSGQVFEQETHASVPPSAYSRGLRILLPPAAGKGS